MAGGMPSCVESLLQELRKGGDSISISTNLSEKLFSDLGISTLAPIELPGSVISNLVKVLPVESRQKWCRLDPAAFFGVACIVLVSEASFQRDQSLYRLQDVLESFECDQLHMLDPKTLTNYKIKCGEKLVPYLASEFLSNTTDTTDTSMAKRWIGMLLVRLLAYCDQNKRTVHRQAKALYPKCGEVIYGKGNRVVRFIALCLVLELLSLNKRLSPAAKIPVSAFFVGYEEDILSPELVNDDREKNYIEVLYELEKVELELPNSANVAGFNALHLSVAGKEFTGSAVLVSVDKTLSICTLPIGDSGRFSWVDIDILRIGNIEILVDEQLSQESNPRVELCLQLKPHGSSNGVLCDMQPFEPPNAIQIKCHDNDADDFAERIEEARNAYVAMASARVADATFFNLSPTKLTKRRVPTETVADVSELTKRRVPAETVADVSELLEQQLDDRGSIYNQESSAIPDSQPPAIESVDISRNGSEVSVVPNSPIQLQFEKLAEKESVQLEKLAEKEPVPRAERPDAQRIEVPSAPVPKPLPSEDKRDAVERVSVPNEQALAQPSKQKTVTKPTAPVPVASTSKVAAEHIPTETVPPSSSPARRSPRARKEKKFFDEMYTSPTPQAAPSKQQTPKKTAKAKATPKSAKATPTVTKRALQAKAAAPKTGLVVLKIGPIVPKGAVPASNAGPSDSNAGPSTSKAGPSAQAAKVTKGKTPAAKKMTAEPEPMTPAPEPWSSPSATGGMGSNSDDDPYDIPDTQESVSDYEFEFMPKKGKGKKKTPAPRKTPQKRQTKGRVSKTPAPSRTSAAPKTPRAKAPAQKKQKATGNAANPPPALSEVPIQTPAAAPAPVPAPAPAPAPAAIPTPIPASVPPPTPPAPAGVRHSRRIAKEEPVFVEAPPELNLGNGLVSPQKQKGQAAKTTAKVAKATAAKKPAAKKSAANKPAAKKPVAKKPAAKKTPAKGERSLKAATPKTLSAQHKEESNGEPQEAEASQDAGLLEPIAVTIESVNKSSGGTAGNAKKVALVHEAVMQKPEQKAVGIPLQKPSTKLTEKPSVKPVEKLAIAPKAEVTTRKQESQKTPKRPARKEEEKALDTQSSSEERIPDSYEAPAPLGRVEVPSSIPEEHDSYSDHGSLPPQVPSHWAWSDETTVFENTSQNPLSASSEPVAQRQRNFHHHSCSGTSVCSAAEEHIEDFFSMKRGPSQHQNTPAKNWSGLLQPTEAPAITEPTVVSLPATPASRKSVKLSTTASASISKKTEKGSESKFSVAAFPCSTTQYCLGGLVCLPDLLGAGGGVGGCGGCGDGLGG